MLSDLKEHVGLARRMACTRENLYESMSDVCTLFQIEFENLNDIRFDLCVFLTCTDIFRSVNWITGAIQRLENDSTLDSVFAASPTHKN